MNWDAILSALTAMGVVVAGVGVYISARVTRKLHEDQRRERQRQQLLPIWKEMLEISRVKSDDPDPDDVRLGINLLSLVAQCSKLEIVEEATLQQMFGRVYVDVYNDILSINKPITLGVTTKPGRDFITDIPMVKKVYDRWSVET